MKKIILLLLICLILVGSVDAIAIGVNKATIDYRDVLRGGFSRDTLMVTTDSEVPITAEIFVEGDASEWMNFSAEYFNFSKDSPYELVIDFQPPIDAEVKNYDVNLSILTGEISRSGEGQLGTSTRASLGIKVRLWMTGNEIARCGVGGVSVRDTEEGQPLQVELSMHNTGNVRLNPEVQVTVLDKFRAGAVETNSVLFGSSVLPTLSGNAIRQLGFELEPDQYWAHVEVPRCGYSGVFTFDVLQPGGTKDDGDFIRIDAESWVNVGDIVPISAIFRNRGIRSVRANFRGKITDLHNDQIVKVIDTDQYLVDPGLTAEMETFFNPVLPGRYMVTGKVFYNDKLTGEKSIVINVLDEGESKKSVFNLNSGLWLVAIAIVILILLIMIRGKKRRKSRAHHRRR